MSFFLKLKPPYTQIPSRREEDWNKILKSYPTMSIHLPKKTLNVNQTNFTELEVIFFFFFPSLAQMVQNM